MKCMDDPARPATRYAIDSANDSALMETASTQLGSMPQPRSRSWAVRLLVLAYGAFSIILLASFTANLAAFLTVKQLTAQVDSPLTLLRHGGPFSVTASGSTASYFQAALDPVALALAPRMRLYPSTDTALAAVRNGAVFAFLTDQPTLQYYAAIQPCDLSVNGQPFGPNTLSFGLQKDSPLTTPMNNAILEVLGNSVLDQIISRWTTDIDKCQNNQQDSTSSQLSLAQMAGLFYMLLLAVGLGLLIAAGERLVLHLLKTRPVLRKWASKWGDNLDTVKTVYFRQASRLNTSFLRSNTLQRDRHPGTPTATYTASTGDSGDKGSPHSSTFDGHTPHYGCQSPRFSDQSPRFNRQCSPHCGRLREDSRLQSHGSGCFESIDEERPVELPEHPPDYAVELPGHPFQLPSSWSVAGDHAAL